jgi:hypothetical protein
MDITQKLDKILTPNRRSLVALAVSLVLFWLSLTSIVYREILAVQYAAETEQVSRNVYDILKRDATLSASIASTWDFVPSVEIRSDTLTIRFAEVDSVRYYLGPHQLLYREESFIADHVRSFHVSPADSSGIRIQLDVGARQTSVLINGGKPYHRVFEWTVVPHDEL